MNKTFNLAIRVPDTEIEISDLDIDFDIIKNNKQENNKAILTVWNLSDTNYYNLCSNRQIEFYAGYEDLILAFKGEIENITKKELIPDKAVIIEVLDGKYKYVKMNKNYRSTTSSTQIIKDCISAMGLGISKMSEKLPEKSYTNYKAVGYPHVILQNITKPLGIICSIQNNMMQVISPDEKPDTENLQVLDGTNSMSPSKSADGSIEIDSKFMPALNPNDYVDCQFTGFSGINRVEAIHSFGNNYGKAGTTIVRF